MRKSKKIKNNQDRLFYIVCYAVITLLALSVLYPIIYIISSSFSSPNSVVQGDVWLWPVNVTTMVYEKVVANERFWLGYANTVFYTVVGTLIRKNNLK